MVKTNLFFFHPYSGFGGADRSIARVINGLNKKKYKIFFISISRPNIKIFINKKVTYVRLRSINTIFSINKLYKILKKNININQKNILVSNQNFANVLVSFFFKNRSNLKIVLIERNSIKELNTNKNSITLVKNFFIKIMMKLYYKHSDLVICISKNLSSEIKKFTKARTFTIYNPALDNSIFKKEKKMNDSFSHKKNIILSIGRLEKQKDQITLLKALNLLKDRLEFFLIILGYGSLYKELKNFISVNNLSQKIRIIRNIKNPNYFLMQSDLFILTSKYEGFGNVLVEASAKKVPIISSNCNHGPNEILQNGKYGTLFKVGDYKDLSNKIINHFKNPSIAQKKANRNFYDLNRFNTKDIIKSYEKIFNKI
jgi:glycosyltransferase involved in cell wall biosynthesis